MSIIAVVGPVGSGKYAVAASICQKEPNAIISSISDNWKVLRESGFYGQRPIYKILVVTNGGSIFFHKDCPEKTMRYIYAVYAPHSVIALAVNIRICTYYADKDTLSHEDFRRGKFCRASLRMIRTPGSPGYPEYLRILQEDTRKTIETCDARAATGEYRVGGEPEHSSHTWFLSTSQMHDRMVKVTRRNLKHQLVLCIWANQTRRTLTGY